MSYTICAPAKINIGLDVLRRLPSGYHELKMIMQTIDLQDVLEVEVTDADDNELICNDSSLPSDDNNLVMKVIRLMQKNYGIEKSLKVKLTKNIPVAAGMAGGSTDAAAMFLAVNDIFELNISKEKLMEMAVELGADIPYCIMQGTALSEGIGEVLTKLPNFDGVTVLIAKPPIEVSTGFVYGNLKLTEDVSHPDIDAVMAAMQDRNYGLMAEYIGNILETVTIPAYPVIEEIKQCMKDNGAFISLMSGSGPTVFGLFEDDETAALAKKACEDMCDGIFTYVAHTYNP